MAPMAMLSPDWLAENEALVRAAARGGLNRLDDPAAVASLRERAAAPDVRLAIELVAARQRAAGKLDRAEQLLLDNLGAEQATSTPVARHKAKRFAAGGVGAVVDLCCGIGGDAMALAQVADVTLIDRDPARAAMGRFNVQRVAGKRCAAAAADATTLAPGDRAFHLDPSRRAADRRTHRYADYQPGPAFIQMLAASGAAGAIKLGPGVAIDALPPGEVEFISERRTLVQAVLWTGRLSHHRRCATCLPAGACLAGEPGEPPYAPLGRFLHTVDAAVERADLLNVLCDQLGVAAVHPKLGIVTADRSVRSAWLTPFELIQTMPWRPKRVKQWLAAHDAGIVEVKTRGKAVDPDRAQRELRGEGDSPFTVFVLRYDRRVVAHITRRL